jgi:aspartate/methionine/tyrosine aminotransferase
VRGPEPLIARLTRLQVVGELGGSVPGQLAAAELLPRLEPLIARQAGQREAGHDHLRAELARYLPDWEAPPVRGGQTLWVRLPRGDGSSFAQEALQHQVAVLPGSGFDASGQSEDRLRIHFLAEPDVLTEAVRRLARAWHAYRAPPGRAPGTLTM